MNYYKNNAYSVLASSILADTDTLALAAGTGARFPAANFLVTLIGYDGSGNESAWEIVRCTARAGDILTVVRAQEGTTAIAWPDAARIENRVTAAAMEELQNKHWADITNKPAVIAAGADAASARAAIGAANVANVVTSLNGETGALVKTTLAGYGITDDVVIAGTGHSNTMSPLGMPGISDLNHPLAGINWAIYTNSAENTPFPHQYGVLHCYGHNGVNVPQAGAWVYQFAYPTGSSVWFRNNINGEGWTAWAKIATVSETPVGLYSGTINCAAGNYFTETVSANLTLVFSNIPTGAYSCVLEIIHTAGAITFPAGTVWAGTAPTLTAGKRHLFFFQRCQLGTAGWYVSALAGYPQ